jgi:ubiquitin-like 1-activating enzyme E1 B
MSSATATTASNLLLPSQRIANVARSSKILVVGAGGIGCELVKNLALLQFAKVDVIDLDTIDVSNLNRQLLFRRPHVGHPKCTVSCDVAHEMIACMHAIKGKEEEKKMDCSYTAHHGNVCDNTFFHVPFVKEFDLVLNALDNVKARRRVNRICLAAGVPLVEAGTTGYLGQVNVIDVASQTACFECQTVETPTVYPICTIRSTPTQPVHTIVWAKECYKLLFHDKVQESMLYEDENTPNGDNDNNGDAGENSDNAEEGSGEPSTYMQAVLDLREALRAGAGSSNSSNGINPTTTASSSSLLLPLIQKVLEALYHAEIQKQLDMGRYKTSQTTPTPLPLNLIQEACSSNCSSNGKKDALSSSTTAIWTLGECLAVLVEGIVQTTASTASKPLQAFDKDDDFAMKFVTAASNLRSHVFQIEPSQSFYSAKGIAGNIIPASTNRIEWCFDGLNFRLKSRSRTLSFFSSHMTQLPRRMPLRRVCKLCKHCKFSMRSNDWGKRLAFCWNNKKRVAATVLAFVRI